MEPGEYLTNVLSFSKFASINFEFLEPQGIAQGIARKHLQRLEASWRQEGRTVHCDTVRDGIWTFENNAEALTSADPSTETPVVEIQGLRLVCTGKGTFEAASLARNKQLSPNATTTANNLPSTSSLESSVRNAQNLNSRAAQGNATYSTLPEPQVPSPNLKPHAKAEDVWPSTREVHEGFISAVLGSLVYFLSRDESFIPLNPRTLILNPSKPVGFAGRSLQVANAITLATLDISLTSLGTLVVKAHADTASGLQSLVDAPKASQILEPGAALWLAPGGIAAKFHSMVDEKNLLASSSSQLHASASESRLSNLNEASLKSWQAKCLDWISAKGINAAVAESNGWLFVQILNGYPPYSKNEQHGLPNLEGLTVIPWPAMLCFPNSGSKMSDLHADEKSGINGRDPVSFAESWFTSKDERAGVILKRQKERQIAETRSKEQADIEARMLQSTVYSPAALRRGSNAGAMYPTPPDAIHHPIGATPSFDGAASTPVNLNTLAAQDTGPGQAPPGMTMGLVDGDAEIWASSVKKERSISNAPFNENETDAENLFGDMGGDMFGTITDADFSFFDEPDAIQIEPKAHDSVAVKQEVPTASDEEPLADQTSNEPLTGTRAGMAKEQYGSAEKDAQMLTFPPGDVLSDVTNKTILRSTSKPTKTDQDAFRTPEAPFNQEAIYRRLTQGSLAVSQRVTSGRDSRFDKVDFEKALASIDEKYGACGQFGFSVDKKDAKLQNTTALPQTQYLNNRKRAQHSEPYSATFARIWNDSDEPDKIEPPEQMDFIMESDSFSQVSEQDDTSHASDDPVLLSKPGPERNWLTENTYGDGIGTPFDNMAIDFEQSVSTPQSLNGSQIPFLDADPADWSLTTYFTTPEPDVQIISVSDQDHIGTAQILADQAVSGTLQLPNDTGDENPKCSNKATPTRELMRSLKKAAKFFFKDFTACTLRSFLEIQGIPAFTNHGLRLPPRPINPRAPHPLGVYSPFPLPPPQLEVRRSDSKLSVLPPAITFWENLGLSPSKGPKNVNAVCAFPEIDGVGASADILLEQMKSFYESLRLGSHERVITKDLVDGLMAFPFEADQKDKSPNIGSLQQTVVRLCKVLAAIPLEERNLVVYFVYPVDNAQLLVHICSSFQALFNAYRKALVEMKTKSFNELVLQLIPLDFIASSTSIMAPRPSEYTRLAMEVYDRCIDFTSASSSPGIMLEQPLPKMIDFKLSATPSASVLQENTCLHVAYAQSIDDRWVTAVWTDNRGTQQMTASYCLGRKNESISRPFTDIAHEVWETTLEFISHKKIHWRVMIARVGVMEPSEMDFWVQLAATEANAQVSLTLITVKTDPSLRLLPPIITLTPNVSAAQSTTPVSTPQHGIVSPENSATPARDNTGGSNEPVEPDADARLIDYTDQSWGAILSHRLNNSNSLLELNPALVSGYLIKRGGTNSDDPPIVIEVNIVYSEVTGNPRTFHESLLKEVLGYYRGLATLARVRGIVDPVKDGRPWHIAAAEKAVKALYMLM